MIHVTFARLGFIARSYAVPLWLIVTVLPLLAYSAKAISLETYILLFTVLAFLLPLVAKYWTPPLTPPETPIDLERAISWVRITGWVVSAPVIVLTLYCPLLLLGAPYLPGTVASVGFGTVLGLFAWDAFYRRCHRTASEDGVSPLMIRRFDQACGFPIATGRYGPAVCLLAVTLIPVACRIIAILRHAA